MAQHNTAATINGIDLETLQNTVSAVEQDPSLGKERNHQQAFELDADEPPMLAGDDQAPNPVEHLLNALAGCITTSMIAHAAVRGIHVEEMESELEGDIDLRGFLGLDNDVPKGYTNIRVKFRAKGDPENIAKLRRLAEFSPVFNTLTHGVNVDIEVEPME